VVVLEPISHLARPSSAWTVPRKCCSMLSCLPPVVQQLLAEVDSKVSLGDAAGSLSEQSLCLSSDGVVESGRGGSCSIPHSNNRNGGVRLAVHAMLKGYPLWLVSNYHAHAMCRLRIVGCTVCWPWVQRDCRLFNSNAITAVLPSYCC